MLVVEDIGEFGESILITKILPTKVLPFFHVIQIILSMLLFIEVVITLILKYYKLTCRSLLSTPNGPLSKKIRSSHAALYSWYPLIMDLIEKM